MKTDIVNGIDLGQLPDVILGAHTGWAELHRLAWRLGARNSKQTGPWRHMDCGFGATCNYQWVWDSCFIAMFCRYGRGRFPGVSCLDIFYAAQRPDGYISMCYNMDDGSEPYPERINPPLFAWAEWEHYLLTGDSSRFARAVPAIERLMHWIDANRRTAPHRRMAATDGADMGAGESADNYQLYWFEDGGSSGMDDSPRTPRMREAGRFFDWIDLSCQMALSFRMLAHMRRVLGQAPEATAWDARAAELGALINAELWSERSRFYHDRMLPSNLVPTKTAAGFWPMLAGVCPAGRAADLVAHLADPRTFNRPMPVPTLSADDPNYTPEGEYWTGAVWPPTNYMIVRGLEQVGRYDEAHRLAVRYLDGMLATYRAVEPHTLWECYSAETPTPGLAPYLRERVRGDFVGWAGIGPIAMLYEQILGIQIDAPAARVTWRIRLTEEHGIRRLPVGAGTIDLLCAHRTDPAAPAALRARADLPLQLHLCCNGREHTCALEPGREVSLTI